jgi:long-subunit fatty acid transport protein
VKAGAAVGVLFKPNDFVQAGFTFTKSPKFKVNERFLRNAGTTPPNLVPFNVAPNVYPDPATLSINVPDRFGFGVAVHPNSRLLIGADVVRINYSSLAKDFLITIDFNNVLPNLFSIDDATEVHFGGEYNLMTGNNPVFVRAGVFTDPNHTTHFNPSSSVSTTINQYYTAVYNSLPRDTQVRGTVGGGIAIGPRVQIDAAYVHKKEFVASTGVRF